MDDSDLQVLRQRSSDRIIRTDRLVLPDPVTTPRMLVRTVSGGSYPTADGRYYLCNPLKIDGSESENGTVSFSADTSITIPVLMIRGVPPIDTNLVARSVGGRWVSEYKASGGGTISFCSCSAVPTTLTLTRGVTSAGVTTFYSSTIVYSATNTPPGCASPSLGPGWLGAYNPTSLDTVNPDRHVFLDCSAGFFRLRFVYGSGSTPVSPCSTIGNTTYSISPGFNRNTCSPFYLIDSTPVGGGTITP